jgi:hypothetical protein
MPTECNRAASSMRRGASPGLQRATGDATPASQRRDIDPRLQALRDQRRLLGRCPSPPTRDASDQFDPAIFTAFVLVLMHGTIAGTIHLTTRKPAPNPRHWATARPRREVGRPHRLRCSQPRSRSVLPYPVPPWTGLRSIKQSVLFGIIRDVHKRHTRPRHRADRGLRTC